MAARAEHEGGVAAEELAHQVGSGLRAARGCLFFIDRHTTQRGLELVGKALQRGGLAPVADQERGRTQGFDLVGLALNFEGLAAFQVGDFARAEAVRAAGADLGVAWDGDFDRCFLFDETGAFVAGEYVVGLLAEVFCAKEPGSTIIHDPRVILATQSAIATAGGRAVMARTGHAMFDAEQHVTDFHWANARQLVYSESRKRGRLAAPVGPAG